MLILAFGVLSMGGLQLASLRSSQSSASFSTAATLAKDYTEMMRSNPSQANITTTTANPYLIDTSSTATYTVSTDCKASVCSASQISALHVGDWVERVTAQLPGGKAVVCRDPAPRLSDGTYRWDCGSNNGTAVTIKLGWTDKRDKEERGTVTMSLTPAKPQLVVGGLTGFSE